MNPLKQLFSFFGNVKNALVHLPIKLKIIIGIVLIIGIGAGVYFFIQRKKSEVPTYQTTTATKGTLISSISGTGTITTGNTTSITTGATGQVTAVYIKNGDTVKKGDKIAELSLDQYGTKRLAAAWLSYINAVDAVKTSQKDQVDDDTTMWNKRQAILDAEKNVDYMNTNPINPQTNELWTDNEKSVLQKSVTSAKLAFEEEELKYKNSDASITNASTRVTSALYDYEQVSATILAPSDGIVQNLILFVGTSITNSSDSSISISDGTTSSSSDSTNTLTASSQSVGTVRSSEGQFKATVNLTEVDIPSIVSDQKVTLTMDAFPDKTFTGKVLAVNTSGSVSSGVTSYPVYILLDTTTVNIYPNMAVSVNIITLSKPDVLLVPTTAINTVNGTSNVEVLKNGKASTVQVTIGSASDTQTEIVSGLTEGDAVITGTTNTSATKTTSSATSTKTTTTTSATSIFSGTSTIGGSSGGMGGPPGGM
jgi:multidrug efflux pump subunit AcrA (membrane-fusion protein)